MYFFPLVKKSRIVTGVHVAGIKRGRQLPIGKQAGPLKGRQAGKGFRSGSGW